MANPHLSNVDEDLTANQKSVRTYGQVVGLNDLVTLLADTSSGGSPGRRKVLGGKSNYSSVPPAELRCSAEAVAVWGLAVQVTAIIVHVVLLRCASACWHTFRIRAHTISRR